MFRKIKIYLTSGYYLSEKERLENNEIAFLNAERNINIRQAEVYLANDAFKLKRTVLL